jgi:hypothetical protein
MPRTEKRKKKKAKRNKQNYTHGRGKKSQENHEAIVNKDMAKFFSILKASF